MARDLEREALTALRRDVANWKACQRAVKAARVKVDKSMVRAVTHGDTVAASGKRPLATRAVVAKIVGLGTSRVATIDGMPKGKNARRDS
jgi:hypothetical protein